MNRFARIGILVGSTSLLASSATSAPKESLHFPYDPACAWGRISDGKGMIIRCLTQSEVALIQATPVTQPRGKSGSTSGAPPPITPPSDASLSVEATGVSSPTNPPTQSQPAVVDDAQPLTCELVEVKAEEGNLPLARRKLGIPLPRYAACVQKNGGLHGATGLVTVQFLVRERGRAEGASVATYQGVTEAAARCIADVVDRRPTGIPEAPVVSASVTFKISQKTVR